MKPSWMVLITEANEPEEQQDTAKPNIQIKSAVVASGVGSKKVS